MNKKVLIPLLLIVLVIVGFGVMRSNSDDAATDEQNNVATNEVSENDSMTSDPMELPGLALLDETNIPDTANVYYFTQESNANYVVQKRFLSRADQEVIGTTPDVIGAGWIDLDSQELNIVAEVNLATLSSDSSTRDSDIQSRFATKLASIEVTGVSPTQIELNVPFEIELPATLNINGTSNEVTVLVSGLITEETFEAEGTADIAMTDYGVEPPSILDVYTVDDEMQITFNVMGERYSLVNDSMMETEAMDSETEAVEETDAMEATEETDIMDSESQ